MSATTEVGVHWVRTPVPGAEDLCVFWSLEQDVLSHLGHTSSRFLVANSGSRGITMQTVAQAHQDAMGDRGAATGIEYNGSDMAWAHRLMDPLKQIVNVWGSRVAALENCRANESLPTRGGSVEVDILHETGLVELKLRTGDKKTTREARAQVLAHAAAARQAGLLIHSIEVWYLLEGFIDALQEIPT